ncbi:MAG TPA: hypothetical protein VKT49_22925 [Bryobacteraceae bacterium]|nr:hypothetical protein [Bryobacteraceae bacterium]
MHQPRLTGVRTNLKKRGRPRRDALPDQIRQLRVQGLSFRAIARVTGLGYGTVRRVYLASEDASASAAD